MNLIKIKDVSLKYDISTRTLRYYEDMGLITSTRADDYAYRLYDEDAVKKLEQVLILRKLNISIKDIQRVFSSSESGVVLEILGKKVGDIDNDVALLHELKEIILGFIRHIEQVDFANDSDVKMLYQKAKDIEAQVTDYGGNPSRSKDIHRLFEVAEQLKLPNVSVVKMPKLRAVTSGKKKRGEFFDEYRRWAYKHHLYFKEMYWGDSQLLIYMPGDTAEVLNVLHDHVTDSDTAPYDIIEVEGGLFATGIFENKDGILPKIINWLKDTHFKHDENRYFMSHPLHPCDEIKVGLGYHQVQRYVPITFDLEGWETVYSLADDGEIQNFARDSTVEGFNVASLSSSGGPMFTFCESGGKNGIFVDKRNNDWDGVDIKLESLAMPHAHHCMVEVEGRIVGDFANVDGAYMGLTGLPGYEDMALHFIDDRRNFKLLHMLSVVKEGVLPTIRISSTNPAAKVPFIIDSISVIIKPFLHGFHPSRNSHPKHVIVDYHKDELINQIPAGKYIRTVMPPDYESIDNFRKDVLEKYLPHWSTFGITFEICDSPAIEIQENEDTVLLFAIRQDII